MTKFLARFISFIANPIFIILPIPYYLVHRVTGNTLYALQWTLFSALFMAIVGGFVWINVKRGRFSDLDVSKREQRPLLFLACLVISLWYMVGLILLKGPLVLFFLTASIIFSLIVISFINTEIKASIHVATISAVLTALSIMQGGVNLPILSLIPIIAWARMKIHRHTLSETVVGGVTGCLLTVLIYVIMRYIFHYSLT